MVRNQLDRYHCGDCGADTEILDGSNTQGTGSHIRCCRFCGNEVEVIDTQSYDSSWGTVTVAEASRR